jgi:hypothetical protein
MASIAAWLPFARAAAIGWAPLAREYSIIAIYIASFPKKSSV